MEKPEHTTRFLTEHGRKTVALWCVGPVTVLALERSGQHSWLAGFLLLLAVLGPVAHWVSERSRAC